MQKKLDATKWWDQIYSQELYKMEVKWNYLWNLQTILKFDLEM